MRRPATELPRLLARRAALAALAAAAAFAPAARAQNAANMLDTKHNLSISGPGTVRALTEDRICIFCHTPHNSTPQSPLWNRELPAQTYTVYASPTLRAGPLPQPTGPTKLCLSCHDGMIAMGTVVNPSGGIAMSGGGRFPPGSLSEFGLDLSGHHPVSFPYDASLPNPELAPTPPEELVYGGVDEVHCITCHDPHDDTNGRFLLKDNRYSALCITCHRIPGWEFAAHAVSSVSVVGSLPRPPKTWPTWTTLGEWGCETCHTPHFAPTAPQLLNFTSAPPNPFSCTSSGCHTTDPDPPHLVAGTGAAATFAGAAPASPRRVDIGTQVRRPSAHHEPPDAGTVGASPDAARSGVRSVTCADCHNPHLARAEPAEAPYVSGLVRGVRGVDRNGAPVEQARYEYEICFKCHGDATADFEAVPRVVASTNTRLDFETSNPSYHPVVGMGRNLDLPSMPSTLAPDMSASRLIYCTTCHADDQGGSRGPHGSNFAPILKERYETADGLAESYESYALCYRCHERTSILRDDSFRRGGAPGGAGRGGHSGHLAAGISCAACHDPHGVDPDAAGASGSHTHLINFDRRVALPLPGARYPVFTDTGSFSGSCALVCHGVVHDNLSYR